MSEHYRRLSEDEVQSAKSLKVTLVRSMNGRQKSHQDCVRGLGIRRMHQTVEVINTAENRGMINKAYYMLHVEGA